MGEGGGNLSKGPSCAVTPYCSPGTSNSSFREIWHDSTGAARLRVRRSIRMTMSALMPVMQEYCDVAIGPLIPDDSAALFRWVNDVKSASLDVAYRPVDGVAFNAWLGTFATDTSKVLFVIRKHDDAMPR